MDSLIGLAILLGMVALFVLIAKLIQLFGAFLKVCFDVLLLPFEILFGTAAQVAKPKPLRIETPPPDSPAGFNRYRHSELHVRIRPDGIDIFSEHEEDEWYDEPEQAHPPPTRRLTQRTPRD